MFILYTYITIYYEFLAWFFFKFQISHYCHLFTIHLPIPHLAKYFLFLSNDTAIKTSITTI